MIDYIQHTTPHAKIETRRFRGIGWWRGEVATSHFFINSNNNDFILYICCSMVSQLVWLGQGSTRSRTSLLHRLPMPSDTSLKQTSRYHCVCATDYQLDPFPGLQSITHDYHIFSLNFMLRDENWTVVNLFEFGWSQVWTTCSEWWSGAAHWSRSTKLIYVGPGFRLVLGLVTVSGFSSRPWTFISACNQILRPTQPSIPLG